MKKVKVTYAESINFAKPTNLVVCDPCYFFENEGEHDKMWSEICKQMFNPKDKDGNYPPQSNMGIVEIGELKFFYSGTAYGDGCYPVSYDGKKEGDSIGVDAGLICVVPLDEVMKFNPKFDANREVIIFDYKGRIEADGNGNLKGDNGFSVITESPEEEEEEEDLY